MNKESVVYRQGNIGVEALPAVPLREGEVLAKPLYVYLGDIERGVLTGAIASKNSVVLGSAGVVKVIEVLGEDESLVGKNFLVKPFGARGILGAETDGLLSTYLGLHKSYLGKEVVDPRPSSALRPLASHAVRIASRVSSTPVVEGCGITSLLTALALRNADIEPWIYCEQPPREFYALGFQVAKHENGLSPEIKTAILTSWNKIAQYKLLQRVRPEVIVVSSLAIMRWLPLYERAERISIYVEKDFEVDEESELLVNNVLRKVRIKPDERRGERREVEVEHVEATKMEDVLGLLPPPRLGLVVSVK